MGAAQASAHESHAKPTVQAETVPLETAADRSAFAADVLCKTVRAIAVAAAESHEHVHDHAHGHGVEHDPTDHQHPPGDDVFHQMAAHGCPDFAAHLEFTPKRTFSSAAHPFPLRHEVAEGIALVPPVPPPLG